MDGLGWIGYPNPISLIGEYGTGREIKWQTEIS